jgi:hypothetical protein
MIQVKKEVSALCNNHNCNIPDGEAFNNNRLNRKDRFALNWKGNSTTIL